MFKASSLNHDGFSPVAFQPGLFLKDDDDSKTPPAEAGGPVVFLF